MLHIVTGPPAAGKSTYVRNHAKPGDITIDLDHIANTLSGQPMDNHEHQAHVLTTAKAARQAAIDTAIKQDCTVWLIHTKPTPKQLQRYQDLGAEIHTIDPGKKVVMNRCKTQRPHGSLIAAATWYDKPNTQVTITTGKQGRTKRGDITIDASRLPNPHEVPKLRVLNGTHAQVQDWLITKPEYAAQVQTTTRQVIDQQATTVTITCSAGKHRSVALGEHLAAALRDVGMSVTVNHTVVDKPKGKRSRHERGYDRRHELDRQRLVRAHKDGTPCWWCGQPMYRDKRRNHDGLPLCADHEDANGARDGKRATRLLHFSCNSSRKDGSNDKNRPAIATRPSEASTAPSGGGSGFVW